MTVFLLHHVLIFMASVIMRVLYTVVGNHLVEYMQTPRHLPSVQDLLSVGVLHAQALYSWWQYELCDVFIELVKPVIPRPATEAEAAGAETAAPAASTSSPAEQLAYKDTLWLCLDIGFK